MDRPAVEALLAYADEMRGRSSQDYRISLEFGLLGE
jgi:hypothetical protein